MDTALVGEIAAKAIDGLLELEGDPDAKVIACGVVVVVDTGDGDTLTRVYTSSLRYFEKIGLFDVALEVLKDPDPS